MKEDWSDEEYCLEMVKKNGDNIDHVVKPTLQIIKIALENCFHAMWSVKKKDQTREICLYAVQTNPFNIEYICTRRQTQKLCMVAIKGHPYSLRYVKNQTRKLCLVAINRNPKVLCFIKEPSEEIIATAVARAKQLKVDLDVNLKIN